jgi:hypothetical protein
MDDKKFEIVLINDKKDMVARAACISIDECWVDMGYCSRVDSCGFDYAPGS